jgi:hypothetical protein
MGNAQVMTAKVSWDNASYWAVTALLFFQRRLRQPAFMDSIEPLMRRFFVLHARLQQLLREWDRLDAGAVYPAGSTSIVDVGWLRRLQASLDDPPMDDDEIRARLTRNLEMLENFAAAWQEHAIRRHPAMTRFVHVPAGATPLEFNELILEPLTVKA